MRNSICRRLFFFIALSMLPALISPNVVHGRGGAMINGKVNILKLNGEERDDPSNVVVFLDRVNNRSASHAPKKTVYISQKDRRFTPRVLAVMKGATVHFPNDDTIFHNVFSLSRSQPFDLGIYKQGDSKSVTFTSPGLVRVYCNLHPMMVSNILILDNPFFTLTDEKGVFAIPDVPYGTYVLRLWHESGEEVRKEIIVSSTSSSEYLHFEIQETKITMLHKNKFGKPYKAKY